MEERCADTDRYRDILWRYLCDYRSLIQGLLNIILTILLAYIGLVSSLPTDPLKVLVESPLQALLNPVLWILLVIVFLQIAFCFIDQKCSKKLGEYKARINQLEKENESLSWKTREIVEDNILTIQENIRYLGNEKLEFGRYDYQKRRGCEPNNERITLYYYDEEEEYFIPVARYSQNMTYTQLGRPFYPANQGVIGYSWNNGSRLRNNYVDPKKDPDRYYEQLEQEGIPRSVAENFAMKPRALYCYRISDGDRKNYIGMIVVESTYNNRFTEEGLNSAFNSCDKIFYDTISRVLRKITPYIKSDLKQRFNLEECITPGMGNFISQKGEEIVSDPEHAKELGY